MTMKGACFGVLLGFVLAPVAMAQQMPSGLSGTVAGMSDLVDRGLSLSDEDPSASAALFLDFGEKFYAGANVAHVDAFGADVRAGGILGMVMPLDAYELDLSVSVDGFLGGDDFVYPEMRARLSRDLGLFYAAAGLSYAPDGRWAVRNEQTLYGYVETEVPIPGLPWLTGTAHVAMKPLIMPKTKPIGEWVLQRGIRSLNCLWAMKTVIRMPISAAPGLWGRCGFISDPWISENFCRYVPATVIWSIRRVGALMA
ncbi:hypothetical protein JCM17845_05270 [Iodidimonas gelatinilytica]|uniref:Uncharacterized protein n=1 Tax=Iodidimonas gelatinilytica TaxID=1236966 RepID=A0A5A7MX38_9PROT|nr:hypothetical protein [Iodidimonas gelatinilytica]GEQ99903.1 hypothetical protein JCM17845_05270 [Iodidimonas gelatinilytica]